MIHSYAMRNCQEWWCATVTYRSVDGLKSEVVVAVSDTDEEATASCRRIR